MKEILFKITNLIKRLRGTGQQYYKNTQSNIRKVWEILKRYW